VPITRVAIVARLKDGCEPQAAELLAEGPPFDPHARGFDRHTAYLSAGEVIFVFEGSEVDVALDDLVDDPFQWDIISALDSWRPLITGNPRIARLVYDSKREA
jgi:hypothetical protein